MNELMEDNTDMIILIMGAPGAGKGTQADLLAETLHIPKISTGDIFRKNIAGKTDLGKKALAYIEKGKLVPDDITVSIVNDRITNDDCVKGFILDGFPRTLSQAVELDSVLTGIGKRVDKVFNIEVKDDCIIKRLGGRRVCPQCGRIYHITSLPPMTAGICNECKLDLIIRDDDSESTILRRLNVYHAQTEPLVKYYKEQGKLNRIDGELPPEDVTRKIFEIVRKDGRIV